MGIGIRLALEPLRSLAFGSIGASYVAIGSQFSNPIRMYHLQNLTDAKLLFSFDGTNDHLRLAPGGFQLIDVMANQLAERGFFVGEGDQIFVKRDDTPTLGTVDLCLFYAVN